MQAWDAVLDYEFGRSDAVRVQASFSVQFLSIGLSPFKVLVFAPLLILIMILFFKVCTKDALISEVQQRIETTVLGATSMGSYAQRVQVLH